MGGNLHLYDLNREYQGKLDRSSAKAKGLQATPSSKPLWRVRMGRFTLYMHVDWRFLNPRHTFTETTGTLPRTLLLYSDVVHSNTSVSMDSFGLSVPECGRGLDDPQSGNLGEFRSQ